MDRASVLAVRAGRADLLSVVGKFGLESLDWKVWKIAQAMTNIQ